MTLLPVVVPVASIPTLPLTSFPFAKGKDGTVCEETTMAPAVKIEIRRELTVPVPVTRVWRAITDPAEVNRDRNYADNSQG